MKKTIIAIAATLSTCALAEPISQSEIEKTLIKKDTYTFDLSLTKNNAALKESLSDSITKSKQIDTAEAAKKFSELMNSENFKSAQENWRQNLAEKMNVELPAKSDDEDNLIPYSGKPILFASSSIPLHTLRQYARDLEEVKGLIVIRGFIGGISQLKPTIAFTDSILKKDINCKTEPCERWKTSVSVDPIIFKEYGITSVPALAIHGITNLKNYCNGIDGLNISQNVAYGDYSISHLIKELAEKGDDSNAKIMMD